MASIPSKSPSGISDIPDFTISKGRLHVCGIDDPKGISIVSSVNGWIQEKTGHATKEFKLPNGRFIRINIKSMQKYLNRLDISKGFIKAHFSQHAFKNAGQLPTALINLSQCRQAISFKHNMIHFLNNELKKPIDQRDKKIAEIYRQGAANFGLLEEVCRYKKMRFIKNPLIDEISLKPHTISCMYKTKAQKTHEKWCQHSETQKKKQNTEWQSPEIYLSFHRSLQKKQRAKSFDQELAETYQASQSAKENGSFREHMIRFLPVMDQISLRNSNNPVTDQISSRNSNNPLTNQISSIVENWVLCAFAIYALLKTS